MALQKNQAPMQLLVLQESSGAAMLKPSSVVAAVFAAVVAAVAVVAAAVLAAAVAVVAAFVAVATVDVVEAVLLFVVADNFETMENPLMVRTARLLEGAFPPRNEQSCISNRGRSVPLGKIDRAWFCGKCLWHEVHPLCGRSSS